MTNPDQKRTSALYHDPAGPRAPAERGSTRFAASLSIGVFAAVVAALVAIGPLLAMARVPPVLILIIGQALCIAGIPLIAARLYYPGRVAAAVGLRRPSGRALAGAALVGASFWCFNLLLVAPLSHYLVGPDPTMRELEGVLAGTPVWLTLLAAAVVPAVCEEILLRGVVARGLEARIGTARAVVVSALLFSLLHLSPVRLLPTAIFGLVLAYAALRADSIIPAMVMHFLNNAVALALFAGLMPWLLAAMEQAPLIILGSAAAMCAAGIGLLRRSAPAGTALAAGGEPTRG